MFTTTYFVPAVLFAYTATVMLSSSLLGYLLGRRHDATSRILRLMVIVAVMLGATATATAVFSQSLTVDGVLNHNDSGFVKGLNWHATVTLYLSVIWSIWTIATYACLLIVTHRI